MTERAERQLRIATAPIPNSDDTEIEIAWGHRELGSLTLHPDDFAEFLEFLRAGFPRVVIATTPTRKAAERQKRRDIAEFVAGLPEPDEQDD